MNFKGQYFFSLAAAVLLASCAGQPENYSMGNNQTVTMPKGTMSGGASVGDANALAQMVQDSNQNTMRQFDQVNGNMAQLQATDNQDLKNSQEALTKLEQLSDQQGSGSITLFFAEGSAQLNQEQTQRLIRFLDYLSRESHGRKVILVSIGSASAIGSPSFNHQLSDQRSQSPLPTIQMYLVNTPHQVYKASGVGDMYAPKDASMQVEQRYQNVLIVAAYSTSQLPSGS